MRAIDDVSASLYAALQSAASQYSALKVLLSEIYRFYGTRRLQYRPRVPAEYAPQCQHASFILYSAVPEAFALELVRKLKQ